MVVLHNGIITFIRREGHNKMFTCAFPCHVSVIEQVEARKTAFPNTDGVNIQPPDRDKTNACRTLQYCVICNSALIENASPQIKTWRLVINHESLSLA